MRPAMSILHGAMYSAVFQCIWCTASFYPNWGVPLGASHSKEKQLENDVSCIMLCEALSTFTSLKCQKCFLSSKLLNSAR